MNKVVKTVLAVVATEILSAVVKESIARYEKQHNFVSSRPSMNISWPAMGKPKFK